MFGRDTIIEIIPRRVDVSIVMGGPTTTEKLDWYDAKGKLTKPLEHHLLFELVNSTVADVSRKADVDYHTVDALIDSYIETDIDSSTIKTLGVLGLDEISMKKGYRDFVTLITYRVDDRVNILGVMGVKCSILSGSYVQSRYHYATVSEQYIMIYTMVI
ncbi:transposase family protein [Moritella sp. 36]|uniref:transposase family protein n=1 Tax=Moritella sp. 36 TaxID=2746233 RepID=UPI001BAD2FD9|nr:transposase family protein [Moritella sp. 36]QUM87338.1 transposase family protein [Moritella sp. 36]